MKSIRLDVYKPKSLMNYVLQPGGRILTQETNQDAQQGSSLWSEGAARRAASSGFVWIAASCEKGEKDSSQLKSKTSKNQFDFKGKVKIIMTLSSLSPTQ